MGGSTSFISVERLPIILRAALKQLTYRWPLNASEILVAVRTRASP